MLSIEQLEAILKRGDTVGTKEARELIQENAVNGELFRRAANNGLVNVVKFFIEAEDHFELTVEESVKCSNRGAASQGGLTPLHFAAYRGFTDIVECLVKKESVKGLQGPYVITPLYCASRQGHLNLVKLFLSYKFSSRQQQDAINVAAYKGQFEIVKYLYSLGIPADEAMCYAAGEGREDIVRFLLLNNVHADTLGESKVFFQPAHGGHLGLIEIILEENLLLDCSDAQVESVLISASQLSGCFWDVGDETAIHLATRGGHFSIVQLFLEANTCVNVQNRSRYTPLDTAVEMGHTRVAVLLQSYGGILNKEGEFLKQAIEKGKFLAVLCFQAMQVDLNFFEKTDPSVLGNEAPVPLHIATLNNHRNIVQYLLEHNTLVDARDNQGITPLHYACAGGYSPLVRLLVKHGASVNTKNKRGESSLTLSLVRGSAPMIKYLLEKDACPNIRSNEEESAPLHGFHYCHEDVPRNYMDGEDFDMVEMGAFYYWTPLHRAALLNNVSAAILLIEFGAHVNALNQDRRTPLHNVQSVEMAKLLLKNGADPLIRDKQGLTPLLCAEKDRRNEIVSVLEKYVTK